MANETLFLDQTKAYTVPQENPSRNYLKGNAGVASWDLPSDQYKFLNGAAAWIEPEIQFKLENHGWDDIKRLSDEILSYTQSLDKDETTGNLTTQSATNLLNKYGDLLGQSKPLKVNNRNDNNGNTIYSTNVKLVSIGHKMLNNANDNTFVGMVFMTDPLTEAGNQIWAQDTSHIENCYINFWRQYYKRIEQYQIDGSDNESYQAYLVAGSPQIEATDGCWSYSTHYPAYISVTTQFITTFFPPSNTEIGGTEDGYPPFLNNASHDRIKEGTPFRYTAAKVASRPYHTRSFHRAGNVANLGYGNDQYQAYTMQINNSASSAGCIFKKAMNDNNWTYSQTATIYDRICFVI